MSEAFGLPGGRLKAESNGGGGIRTRVRKACRHQILRA